MIKRIEALADAFKAMHGFHTPDSEAYQARNPGMLKAFSPRHAANDHGRRIFPSAIDGYQALLFDLKLKCSGNSRSKLTPQSTLCELVRVYGQPDTAAEFIIKFLRRALAQPEITAKTPLAFFVEEQ